MACSNGFCICLQDKLVSKSHDHVQGDAAPRKSFHGKVPCKNTATARTERLPGCFVSTCIWMSIVWRLTADPSFLSGGTCARYVLAPRGVNAGSSASALLGANLIAMARSSSAWRSTACSGASRPSALDPRGSRCVLYTVAATSAKNTSETDTKLLFHSLHIFRNWVCI